MIRIFCFILLVAGISVQSFTKPLSDSDDYRLGNLNIFCQLFCGNDQEFISFDNLKEDLREISTNPRIFCGLCRQKSTTTSVTPTPSSTPSSTPTPPPSSTPGSTPGSTPTSAAPTSSSSQNPTTSSASTAASSTARNAEIERKLRYSFI